MGPHSQASLPPLSFAGLLASVQMPLERCRLQCFLSDLPSVSGWESHIQAEWRGAGMMEWEPGKVGRLARNPFRGEVIGTGHGVLRSTHSTYLYESS